YENKCSHYENRTYESERTRFADCPAECHSMPPLYMKTTHVGLVLSLRERNGYDDSDFYALVWNAAEGKPEEILYATTRGWTYPNGASIDATPEVRAAYESFLAEGKRKERERNARIEATVPRVGTNVRVIKGRKLPIGAVGDVFWFGEDSYKAARR